VIQITIPAGVLFGYEPVGGEIEEEAKIESVTQTWDDE
jgi:hypothetical protein